MSDTAAHRSEVVGGDVAICGGGLVGATLALALADLGLEVVLIEAHPFGTFGQPSFDDRTTALSNGSRRVINDWPLGGWSARRNWKHAPDAWVI